MKLLIKAKVAKIPVEFEVGDIVSPKGSNIKYEILELFPDRKVKLHPLEGGFGDFIQKIDGLVLRTAINPKPEPAKVKTGPSCWGCGKDYLQQHWGKGDVAKLGKDKLCPDCYEEIRENPAEYYDVTMGSVRDIVGNAADMGDPEKTEWSDYDYDVDVTIPLKVKKRDGKPFNDDDMEILSPWINKYIKNLKQYRLMFEMFKDSKKTELIPNISFS